MTRRQRQPKTLRDVFCPDIPDRFDLCRETKSQAHVLHKAVESYRAALSIVENSAHRLQAAAPQTAKQLQRLADRAEKIRFLLNGHELATFCLEVERAMEETWREMSEADRPHPEPSKS